MENVPSPVSAACCATIGTIFGYDAMGRITVNNQRLAIDGNNSHPVTYSYDFVGDLVSYTNGMGVTVTQSFDAASHITGVTSSLVDANHPATLWTADSSQGYYPPGALHKAAFGNGITETNVYEARLQPCRMNVNASSSSENLCGDADPSATIQDFGYGYGVWGSSNSGNVTAWSASGTQNFSRSYTYDNLNRLSTMTAPGDNCSGLSWTYDAWGNRTQQNNTGGNCPAPQTAVNANNRIVATGINYDAAGNMYADGTHTYAFDAENQITTVDSGAVATYTYDAFGQRVETNVGGTKTEYIYGIDGHVVAEVDGSGNWQTGYVYMGNQLLAEYANGTTYFIHADHLGSTRLRTTVSGTVYDSFDYPPSAKCFPASMITCRNSPATRSITRPDWTTLCSANNPPPSACPPEPWRRRAAGCLPIPSPATSPTPNPSTATPTSKTLHLMELTRSAWTIATSQITSVIFQ